MKILQVLDLLRNRIVRMEFPDTKEDIELELHEITLVSYRKKEKICAKILALPREVPNAIPDKDYTFYQKLTPEKIEKYLTSQEGEAERLANAQKHAEKLNLNMRFFASKISFDQGTVSFFFISPDPVDFRELLKVLAVEFKSRIHLERVGPRDKAKVIGGFGICGLETCCSTFKIHFDSVPMDAARDQNLITKDTDKLLGSCGKLKCCLMYELPVYREMRKTLPHIRQTVTLPDGTSGRIVGLDILNQKVKVLMENDLTDIFSVEEITVEDRKKQKKDEKAPKDKKK